MIKNLRAAKGFMINNNLEKENLEVILNMQLYTSHAQKTKRRNKS